MLKNIIQNERKYQTYDSLPEAVFPSSRQCSTTRVFIIADLNSRAAEE